MSRRLSGNFPPECRAGRCSTGFCVTSSGGLRGKRAVSKYRQRAPDSHHLPLGNYHLLNVRPWKHNASDAAQRKGEILHDNEEETLSWLFLLLSPIELECGPIISLTHPLFPPLPSSLLYSNHLGNNFPKSPPLPFPIRVKTPGYRFSALLPRSLSHWRGGMQIPVFLSLID